MDKNTILSKVLAVVGIGLVSLTLYSPLILWIFASLRRGGYDLDHFDYLLPAELFPVALVGGASLLWAALRERRRIRFIIFSLILALLALFGGQLLAVVTGLASGETQPGGWQWALVLASLFIYALGLVALGAGGILLLRDLRSEATSEPN